MFESTSTIIHLSGLQAALLILFAVLAVALPVWAVRGIANCIPPACRARGAASGVGGLLLFTIFMLIVEAVVSLYHFGRAAGEAARVIMMSGDYFWAAAQTAVPDLASSVFLVAAISALVFGRSPFALGCAIAFAWLGGPLVAVLRTIYLGLPIEVAGEPTGLFFMTLLMSVYLLFANRPALTYGTRAGRALEKTRGTDALGV